MLSLAQDMAITGHRHDIIVDYDVKADSDGKIVDASFNANINAGIATDVTIFWLYCLMMRVDGGYTLRKFNMDIRALKTNQPTTTAFRFDWHASCTYLSSS